MNNQPAVSQNIAPSPSSIPPVNSPSPQALLEQQRLQAEMLNQNLKAKKNYIKAYTLSLLLPPVGIYYFIKFLFFADGKPEDMRGGILSLVITLASLLINIWLLSASFGMVSKIGGTNVGGGEFLQELITPANQKDLKNLLQ